MDPGDTAIRAARRPRGRDAGWGGPFQNGISTVNDERVNVYDKVEVDRAATIRKFRMVPRQRERQVCRDIDTAAAQLRIHDARYPDALAKRVGH